MGHHKGSRVASAVVLFVGLACLVLALASNYWVQNANYNAGVWRICFSTDRPCDQIPRTDFIRAVEAMMVIAVIFATAAFVEGLVWATAHSGRGLFESPVGLSGLIFAILAGVFSLVAVTLYPAKYILGELNDGQEDTLEDLVWTIVDMDYAWYVAILGCGIDLFDGIICLAVFGSQARH